MAALPGRHNSWSPFDAILQWCRGWARSSPESELQCFADAEVERIAKDVGVSAAELRTLATFGPEAADLLLRRMTALDLDRNEIVRIEPQTFQDLQRVCIMCDHHRRCERDFAHDPAAGDAWREYCPNAATLIALNALPWAARHEW
jgi:hypothetical protein